MRKKCAVCPAEFEAKRSTAKYCSRKCSMRASRLPKPSRPPEVPGQALTAATLAELQAARRAGTAAGEAVLVLARRIDAGDRETGAALASLVREHRAALASALDDADLAADPVEDELRAARERKRAIAGG